MQETQVQSLGWKDPVEKGMAILEATPAFLPGESHGQGSLVGYSPWGCKELNTVEQLSNNNEPLGAADHLLRAHSSDLCLSQPIANLSL